MNFNSIDALCLGAARMWQNGVDSEDQFSL
jgi:hypothetical protein